MTNQMDRIEKIAKDSLELATKTHKIVAGNNGTDGLLHKVDDLAAEVKGMNETVDTHDKTLYGDKVNSKDLGLIVDFIRFSEQISLKLVSVEKKMAWLTMAAWTIAGLLASGLVKVIFFP